MKKELAQILLVILISVCIPLLAAHLEYRDLGGAGFFACDISIENFDQDNLSMDRQDASEGFLSSGFSLTSTSSLGLLGQLRYLSFTTCSPDQITSTFRC
jgi:hypothetical protein